MRFFVISQFQCCPLVWVFHSRHLNNKVNRVYERALRIAHKGCQSAINILLENGCSVNVKYLKTLVIEIFKTKENLNPIPSHEGEAELFCEHPVRYNLRNNYEFLPPRVRTVSYGTETIKYRGLRLWLAVPQHIRNAQSINEFENHIKNGKGPDCTCRLYRVFVPRLGFL